MARQRRGSQVGRHVGTFSNQAEATRANFGGRAQETRSIADPRQRRGSKRLSETRDLYTKTLAWYLDAGFPFVFTRFPMRTRLSELKWQVGFHKSPDGAPERWVPATVPGAVQLDWARAESWPPYIEGKNWAEYGWMEDVSWVYRACLPDAAVASGMRRHLVLRGVDYQFVVSIDGAVVHEQEGMFAPVDLDITAQSKAGSVLQIRIAPVPKYAGAHRPKAQASRSVKPSVSYGWDFHPRLIPLGIWDDAFVEDRPASHLGFIDLHYVLNASLDGLSADAHVALSAPLPGGRIEWALTAPDGKKVASVTNPADGDTILSLLVEQPQLWWPNGHGAPNLYRSTWVLRNADGEVLDEQSRCHGFRRIQLVMNDGAWDEPGTFPKGRSTPPMTLEVNGRSIFAKGSNWVCPEIFPGIIKPETTRVLVEMAQDAHMNLFRSWGGAIVNKEAFFEQCDEMGIMVWQEFPLACNDYADDPAYLRTLDHESRAIILRLRQHPSVVMWCGGNELFNVWSGMTDQKKALRLLNRNCYDLDPDSPYLPTSPVMGVGHGDYRFRDADGREVFQIFASSSNTAYTEFGCPGPASVDVLKTFIQPADMWPPRRDSIWQTHHAFEAWGVAPESWLFPSLIAEYFGKQDSIESLVAWGQLMQAEGYRCLFEEARRQKPRASMALNWCFNEPWPTAANNSLISWPSKPKPALQAVKDACRPILASARIPRFSWTADDLFSAELGLLNDAPDAGPAGVLRAYLRQDGSETLLCTWAFPALVPNQNLDGPVVRIIMPPGDQLTFELVLRVDGIVGADSTYQLCFRPGLRKRKTVVGFINNA